MIWKRPKAGKGAKEEGSSVWEWKLIAFQEKRETRDHLVLGSYIILESACMRRIPSAVEWSACLVPARICTARDVKVWSQDWFYSYPGAGWSGSSVNLPEINHLFQLEHWIINTRSVPDSFSHPAYGWGPPKFPFWWRVDEIEKTGTLDFKAEVIPTYKRVPCADMGLWMASVFTGHKLFWTDKGDV